MIELALSFQDKNGKYAEHAGVVLASVFSNTNSTIRVHILHDESLNEINKRKLMELAKSYKQTIYFYPVSLPNDMVEAMRGTVSISIWTQACMYRLLLPTLIPVDKIIYLDCDLLVNMDIAELWSIELDHYYLAAIRDQGIMDVAENVITCGLNPELYFNSGVIMFELNNIRQKSGWYEEMVDFLRTFPHTTMPDQDILNSVFGGNYLELDQRYNQFIGPGSKINLYNKIAHFTGPQKCWEVQSPGAKQYQRYLNLTPWKKQKGNSLPRSNYRNRNHLSNVGSVSPLRAKWNRKRKKPHACSFILQCSLRKYGLRKLCQVKSNKLKKKIIKQVLSRRLILLQPIVLNPRQLRKAVMCRSSKWIRRTKCSSNHILFCRVIPIRSQKKL